MKAVVYHGVGDIRLDDVADPRIQQPTDAIIRVTASAICGTDLHLVRGTMPGMQEGTVLGHEAVGVVETVGAAVRGFCPGDRVVVTSTIGCGTCSYCRAGYYAQCDVANPNGPQAGTAFFGGPKSTGPFDGLQAEYARIPYAMSTLVRLPERLGDDDAILTGGIGADRVIDAVGVDAQRPHTDPAEQWQPGDAPSQAARWATQAVAKAGSIGVIGVYPPGFDAYPLGLAMNRNLTIKLGDCNHRRYLPQLLDLVVSGLVEPTAFITQKEPLTGVIDAYETFDRRADGWLKTVLTLG